VANGDVTVSISIAGGVSKSAVFDSATRVKAKLHDSNNAALSGVDLTADADWQVYVVNKLTSQLVGKANAQLESEVSWTAKTFTAAT
jgi:hypothetical protein